jgi:hypothetical protein
VLCALVLNVTWAYMGSTFTQAHLHEP